MPGIIITPGTFNPPATPAQAFGIYVYPKTPAPTIRRGKLNYQFQTRPAPPAATAVTLDITYVYLDYMSGNFAVRVDTATFDSGAAAISLAGARYIPDETYAVTGTDGAHNEYQATATPILTADGGISLGIIECEYGGDFVLPSGGVNLLLAYSLTLSGVGDGATYALNVPNSDDATAASGTITALLSYPVGPASNGFIDQEISQNVLLQMTLFRDGVVYDKVYMAIHVTATVTFTIVPMSPGASLAVPEVDSGLMLVDTLHGAAAAPGEVLPPAGMHLAGYARESLAIQGGLTLP